MISFLRLHIKLVRSRCYLYWKEVLWYVFAEHVVHPVCTESNRVFNLISRFCYVYLERNIVFRGFLHCVICKLLILIVKSECMARPILWRGAIEFCCFKIVIVQITMFLWFMKDFICNLNVYYEHKNVQIITWVQAICPKCEGKDPMITQVTI